MSFLPIRNLQSVIRNPSINFISKGRAAVFRFPRFQIPNEQIQFVIRLEENFDKSLFGLSIEHISIGMFIQSEHRPIEKQETLPRSYRRLDQKFPIYKKTCEQLLFEGTNIVVRNCMKVHIGSVSEWLFFSSCL